MAGSVIRQVSWQGFRVPFRGSFAASNRTMRVRDGLIVQVITDRGAWPGEVSLLDSEGPATVEAAARWIESLGRMVLGMNGEEAWAALGSLPPEPDASMRSATCAVETAVANLASADAGLPMAGWLGGVGTARPVAAVEVNGVIQADATGPAIEAALRLVAGGIRCLKLKMAGDPERAVAHLAGVRAAVGRDVELRADANGCWTAEEAGRFLDGCGPVHLALCEEPLAMGTPDRLRTLAALRAKSPVPLGVDESCRLLADFEAVLGADATDVLVLKPMATGLHESIRMVRRAGERGVPVVVTTTFDGGLGTMMAVQVAATRAGPLPACGLATLDFLEDDLVVEPLAISGGTLALPGRAGLGASLDLEALRGFSLPVSGSIEA